MSINFSSTMSPKPFQFGSWLDDYHLGALSEHWPAVVLSALTSQAFVHLSHYVLGPLLFRRFYRVLTPRKQLDWYLPATRGDRALTHPLPCSLSPDMLHPICFLVYPAMLPRALVRYVYIHSLTQCDHSITHCDRSRRDVHTVAFLHATVITSMAMPMLWDPTLVSEKVPR